MATLRQPAREPATSSPPLSTAGGQPVSVVHVTAEYYPYARIGGLAEAVSGLANFQRAAGLERGRHPAAVPHRARRRSRSRAGGPAVPGSRWDRIPRRPASSGWPGRRPGPRCSSSSTSDYFNRPGIYGENAVDYPDNARRFAFFALAAVTALPRLVPGPIVLHAHDWHTALALVYLRTLMSQRYSSEHYRGALGPQPRVSGPFPARGDAPDRASLGVVQLAPARVVRQGEFPEGWTGLCRLRHHGEPDPGRRSCARPAAASASTTCSSGWRPAGGGAQRDRPANLGSGRTIGQITAQYSAEKLEGKRRCKAALQRSFGLPQRRKVPLFGMTGRMVTQKGLDLILQERRPARARCPVRLSWQWGEAIRDRTGGAGLVRAGPGRRAARLHRSAGAPADGGGGSLSHAVAVRALWPDPDAGAAVRVAPDRARRRRPGRHGRGRGDWLCLRRRTPRKPSRRLPSARSTALRHPAKWEAIMRAGHGPSDFSWERSVATYLDVYRRAWHFAVR